MRTAYLSHPDCLKHEMGPHHPECPARLTTIDDKLIATGLAHLLRHYEAPSATREQLCRAHDGAYVDALEHAAPPPGKLAWLDPDTAMNEHSLRAAHLAAGAVVRAVDLVMAGEVENAFCAVRPPGHHAERARAMGFCLFNNVAVGVAHALAQHGLARVAVVDFDVHHGNGTEKIFAADPRVLLCSSFRHPFYPYADLEHAAPNVVNAPLRGGAYSEEFQQAISDLWLPALERFRPQMVFISAGFDAHYEDEMGGLNLLDSDYAWVTLEVLKVAARYADNRIVSVLEGGYALAALGRSVALHLRCLMGVNG